MSIDRRHQATWWTVFISLTLLVLQGPVGAKGMALFLGIWVLFAAAYPTTAMEAIRTHVFPWVFPVYALSSAFWSVEPQVALRLGTELMLVTGIGFMVARVLTPARFLSALFVALLIGVVLSVLSGKHAVIGTTGENALVGLFASKNNFATYICLMMLAALAVLPDPRQPGPIRLMALGAMAIGPVLLVKTISLGALVAGGGSLGTVGLVLMLWKLPQRLRPVVLLLGAMLAVSLGVFAILALEGGSVSQLLVSAGKDPSLTGRTYLWQRAAQYISERPVFGIGYQSFWVQGHIEAEGLWSYAKIDERSGFHFHNLYYETAVETGLTGVVLLGTFLACLMIKTLLWGVRNPGPSSAFFLGLMVFYVIRMGVELDFLGPFSHGPFLLPIMWVYASRALVWGDRAG